jgi:hypothetical protein
LEFIITSAADLMKIMPTLMCQTNIKYCSSQQCKENPWLPSQSHFGQGGLGTRVLTAGLVLPYMKQEASESISAIRHR